MVNMGWINNEENASSQLQLTFSDISRIHLKLEDSDQSDRMHLDMLDLRHMKEPQLGKGMEIEREMVNLAVNIIDLKSFREWNWR